MGLLNGYSFDKAYESYLSWFHEKAMPSAAPKDREAVLGCQMCQEDVFEDDSYILNRMFFLLPLLPSESKSSRLEIFIITELNLMKKLEYDDDIEYIIPVEYSVQTF